MGNVIIGVMLMIAAGLAYWCMRPSVSVGDLEPISQESLNHILNLESQQGDQRNG